MLVPQRGYDGSLVVVIDWGDDHALGEFVTAVLASEGFDCMFSGFKERSGDMPSDGTSGLSWTDVLVFRNLCKSRW